VKYPSTKSFMQNGSGALSDVVFTHSWQKGGVAVVKVQLRAMELSAMGQRVNTSIPTNPDCRYDMIVDQCGKLYRAQIKYAGGVRIGTAGAAVVSLTKGERGEKRYTSDEIDVLLVYVPIVDKICWFGSEVFHSRTQLHIRYAPTQSGRSKGCVMLEDYVW
jgi:hypothetical protein